MKSMGNEVLSNEKVGDSEWKTLVKIKYDFLLLLTPLFLSFN